MILPFDRARLRERNALDDAEEREAARALSPGEGLLATIAVSQLVRDLARAAGALPDQPPSRWADDLAGKAHLYAEPLELLMPR